MNFFDRAYAEGTPPWEIGRPQPEFVQLETAGAVRGRVLDVGCGTGENAMYFASHGHVTWGLDFAPTAIARARAKAAARGIDVHFEVHSALGLEGLGPTFDTVTDCGVFHTFLDEHRPVYARNVRSVLAPGGRFFLLCFSEREPLDWGGPRRVTQAEIRSTFVDGWTVESIRAARFATNLPQVTGLAWLAVLAREETSTRPARPAPARHRRRPIRRESGISPPPR